MNCCICGGHLCNVELFLGELYCVWYYFRCCFGGCMNYGIFSVTLLLLCHSHILHLVPMILYHLDYCLLLFLFLVGIMVCSCNRILQICECRLICREEFYIFWEDLDWFLPDVVICLTIEGGIIYLLCIFPLWSGSWRSEWISLHCLLCGYLG